jgi:hypothetical protein
LKLATWVKFSLNVGVPGKSVVVNYIWVTYVYDLCKKFGIKSVLHLCQFFSHFAIATSV